MIMHKKTDKSCQIPRKCRNCCKTVDEKGRKRYYGHIEARSEQRFRSGTGFSHNEKLNERGVSLERYLIIIDEEQEYAKALAAFLNNDHGFLYRSVVLSPEEAKEYVKSGAVAMILASVSFEKEILGLQKDAEQRVFWITEDKQDRRDTSVYRYQSAKLIQKRLEGIEKTSGDVPAVGCFSPSGGIWQEALCERIAEGFAEKRRVLSLSFLPFGTKNRGENGMSELLYFARQGKESLAEFLKKQRSYEGNLTVIGPVRWSIDLQRVTASDIERILEGVKEAGEYDLIFFAVGYYDEAGLAVMRACDLLYVPVWEAEQGQEIQEAFIRQLREGGENKLLRCMKELSTLHFEDGVGVLSAARDAVRIGESGLLSEKG